MLQQGCGVGVGVGVAGVVGFWKGGVVVGAGVVGFWEGRSRSRSLLAPKRLPLQALFNVRYSVRFFIYFRKATKHNFTISMKNPNMPKKYAN